MAKRGLSLAVLIALVLAAALTARFHGSAKGAVPRRHTAKEHTTRAARTRPVLRVLLRKSRAETPAPAPFDYYVLSLAWAPGFCAQPGGAFGNPKECAPGGGVGFIVHGLWPEAAAGTNPESCGKSRPVPKPVVNLVLREMLTVSLIQHEWDTHGVCTGLSPFDYFSAIVQARAAVQIPVQIASIENDTRESPGQIETQFAAANPAFPKAAFRTSCPRGVFEEERICFDKNLKPLACTGSVGECAIPAVVIHPHL